jgi:hypothetical protein
MLFADLGFLFRELMPASSVGLEKPREHTLVPSGMLVVKTYQLKARQPFACVYLLIPSPFHLLLLNCTFLSSIIALLFMRSPSNVPWLVMTQVVNTVKRHAFWPNSNFSDQRF